jgi:hypothetical protein
MSQQDQKPARLGGIGAAEPKSPADRARLVQEMQRQLEAQPVTPHQAPAATTPTKQVTQTGPTQQTREVFEAKPVQEVHVIGAPTKSGADQVAYGANQASVGSLFSKGDDVPEPVGNPWKIIPFGPPQQQQVAPVLDLKKPVGEYTFNVPDKAVPVALPFPRKQGAEAGSTQPPADVTHGNLFTLTATPKNAENGAGAVKKAMLVDGKGRLLGAEFKSKESLLNALQKLPDLALQLFQSAFPKDDVKADTPTKIVGVENGKKSAYEVKVSRKNAYDGKWKDEVVTVNNFGLKVPPSNTSDPRRHDINVAMYYLDRFQAA